MFSLSGAASRVRAVKVGERWSTVAGAAGVLASMVVFTQVGADPSVAVIVLALARRFGGEKNPAAKKKAITAIAHTLLKIAYQVLKSGSALHRTRARTSTPRANHPDSARPTWNASCRSCTPAAPSPSPSARRRPPYPPGG